MKNLYLGSFLAAATLGLLTLSASPQSACNPQVTVSGTTCLGDTITVTMSGHLDCKGCLVGSLDPGPTFIGPLTIPVGMPARTFVIGLAGKSRTFTIPNDPVLMNASYYFCAILTDGASMVASPGTQITICP